MQYFFYTCKNDISFSCLASALSLPKENMWVPVALLSFPISSSHSWIISSSHSTSMGLAEKMAYSVIPRVIFDKEVMIRKTNSRLVKEESTTSYSLHVPIACSDNGSWTLYLQRGEGTDLTLAEGTTVLCVERAVKEKVSQGNAAEGFLEGSTRERRHSKKYKKRAESRLDKQKVQDDIQNRLAKLCLANRSLPSFDMLQRARVVTLEKIKMVKKMLPLHYLSRSFVVGSTVLIRKKKWDQADSGVLYQTFEPPNGSIPTNSTENSSCSISFSVAFFFLNGVFLSFPAAHDLYEEEQRFQFVPHNDFKRVGEAVQRYYHKGYRIVILEHIPSLHYGSSSHIELCLGSISDAMSSLVSETNCTVTVLVSPISSILSFFTADSDSHHRLSQPLPDLLKCFVKCLNESVKPDPATSFLVGASPRQSPVVASIHQQFALAASLDYKELDMFLESQV